jgi:Zn-dependent oligopeptidase
VKAKNAGVTIDIQQLKELTGYRLVEIEEKQDTSIWNVPRFNSNEPKNEEQIKPETPVDSPEKSIEEPEPTEVLNNTPETTDASTDEKNDNVKHGVSILKAFGAVLNPIRELFMKLFEAKTRDESKQIAEEIDAKINEIESSEDNELIQAVHEMMKESFEKGSNE